MTRSDAVALVSCAFYFGLGALWIDRPGLQADEVLFAQPVFDPLATSESMSVFHHRAPLMLMSYLGCLKTWLYAPLLALFGSLAPTSMAALIRLPMLAVGALSIWITYCIVRRLHSPRAGVIVTVLLATDTLYLWLSRCDWGPVTLQHLLAAAGVWMLLRFYDGQKAVWLAGAGFAFGLALWDKTVFLWPAAALLTGGALLWRKLLPLVTPKRIAILAACFALGAYPWIRHNVRTGGATFDETGHFDLAEIPAKGATFIGSLNGKSLLGYMVRERGPESAPPDALAAASISVARALRFPRESLTGWAFLAALLAAPFLGRQPRITAAMLLAGFLLMAATKGGGQWPYHSAVLWPLPHIILAFALIRLPLPALASAVGILTLAAVSVTNTHFALLHLYGGSTYWTEAVYQLPAALAQQHAQIEVIDWGILEPMQLLSQGRFPVRGAIDREHLIRGSVYVGHVPGLEVFPDSNTRLTADAERSGCRLRTVATVPDRQGVPVYQLQVCE